MVGNPDLLSNTILVVEDDPAVRSIVVIILEERGYRVLQAGGGEAGLAILDTMRPDLILSDVMMPDLDGLQFFRAVRARPELAEVPFIFLTARSQRLEVREAMALGADDYLVKPFEPEDLLSAVAIRLARAAELRVSRDQAGENLKRIFVQTMAHELRTPLSLVFGYTDLLNTMGLRMSEKDLEMILHGLHTGTRRLMALVEDFLLLVRLESGVLGREVRSLGLSTKQPGRVVREAVWGLEAEAAARGMALILRPGPAPPALPIREEFLVQIVRRLVHNAIKFSKEEGGRTMVTSREDGVGWMLEVIDNGIGIRPEAMHRISLPFFQVDRDKIEQQGVGLGLAIVRGLAEVHGGWMVAESRVGRGSLFRVWLPLAPD